MVYLEHLNIFPEATRLFIIKLADQGHPIAAAIIGLPLDPNQTPPTLNEREEEYLDAAVTLLRAEGTLFPAAEELISPVPRAEQYLEAPAPIPNPPIARPQPSQSMLTTAAAPHRVPAKPHQQHTTLSDAPTRRPAPSAYPAPPGAGPQYLPAAPIVITGPPPPPPQNQRVEEEDGNVEDESEDAANTYSSYVAKNIRELFPNVSAHPDPLVETASLASVQLPDLKIDAEKDFKTLEDDVNLYRLSDAQMESIVYAWTKFEGKRLPAEVVPGFFLGDGAGVGKGRTIAGLVKQHWNNGGNYILWLSVSQDLRRDARRDLDDLGLTDIKIYTPKGTQHIPGNEFRGVVFITYSLLRSGLPTVKKSKRKKKEPAATAGAASGSRVAQLMAMEAAEGAMSGGSTSGSEFGGDDEDEDQEEPSGFKIENLPGSSRLAQVIKWLRQCTKGPLIIFDESHRAKNLLLVNTQTARAVVHLQEVLPKARILYSSATGASEPHNLAYMTRLWGTEETKKMVDLLSRAKLGALELAAISLKATGTYLARTLSYADAEFCLERVKITPDIDLMYERSTYFWTLLYQVMKHVATNKHWQGQFWGAHQRFYRSMLMASKVKKCAELCRDAVANRMSVVIGLQSTGESVTEQMRSNTALDGGAANFNEFDDLVSAPRQILDTFIRNFFPVAHPDAAMLENGGKLESLEYQVWEAAKMWKDMPSVLELAAIVPTATAANGGGAGGSGEGGAGTSAAAAREALLTGQNIDINRILTDGERGRLANDGGALAEELKGRPGQVNARTGALQQDCVNAAGDVYNAKQYRQRVLDAIAVADGTASTEAAAATEPLIVPRGTAASPLFIDLSGDTTDEEEEDKQNNDPAGCMYCLNSPDAAMATCAKCKRKAHAACLDMYSVPVDFTCDTCLIKGAAAVKREPGTATNIVDSTAGSGAVQIKSEPFSRAALVDSDDLALKTLEELRVLLKTADRKVSEAEMKLQASKDQANVAPEQESADGITGQGRAAKANQSPSKAGKNQAQEAVRIKAEQGQRSPVFHPPCVTSTTRTDAIANYRSATERPRERLDTVPDEFPGGNGAVGAGGTSSRLANIRNWLLLLVQAGLDLPANPIDKLIEECGGKDKVAELTGRRGFIELDDDKETARYKLRHDGDGPARELNLREKDRFMNGQKRIAIISDAASTGISLQADKRVASRNFRRLHLTLELPWSADKAVQQFGRSHRANQQSAPVYKILVTPCGGEYRFASAAAKRLQSLGALLRGDRNAVGAGAELKAFDVDTLAGHSAVQRMLRFITSEQVVMPGMTIPELPDNLKLKCGIPLGTNGGDIDAAPNGHPSTEPFNIHFCRRLHSLGLLEEWSENLSGYRVKSRSSRNEKYTGRQKNTGVKVTQFLNRLLGLPIEEQDILFKFFSDTLDATITNLKALGKYDNGIMSLQGRSISKKNEVVVWNEPASGASVKHVTVGLVQGVTFEEAQAMVEEAKQRINEVTSGSRPAAQQLSGFYVQRIKTWSLSGVRHPRIEVALEVPDENASAGITAFIKMREIPPHGQDFPKIRKMEDIRDTSWRPIRNLEEAKTIWDAWYNYTATNCAHGEGCNTVNCKDGCRYTDKHLLCGAVLSHWDRLEKLHFHGPHAKRYPRTLYNESGDRETHYSPNPLFVGRAITDIPGDPESSGEPIVGILAESEEEMQYLKHHMVPRSDPEYEDPLIRALGTNYVDQHAVRGLNDDSGRDFTRRFGSGNRYAGKGKQSKKPKNFR
ncbi:putative Protein FORGETTER 1 [Nannochloris sp. 'desiccata']|nr:putative Protein FORGETTER 1 [Chlorella desiccata (nom. nud.)]